MATFTASVTYPDAKQADLRDTLCLALGYQATIPNPAFNILLPEDPITNPATIANPETKAQFIQKAANSMFRQWVKNTYDSQKAVIAQQAAEKLDTTN